MGQRKGYKQTPEHKAAVAAALGPHRGNWRGNAAKRTTGRDRALRLYPDVGPCTRCGSAKAERHHRDDNTLNNSPENIAILCRRCHMTEDGRLFNMREVRACAKNVGARPKYSAADVWVMAEMKAQGQSQSAIAQRFGTSQSVISRILGGRRRAYVELLERAS